MYIFIAYYKLFTNCYSSFIFCLTKHDHAIIQSNNKTVIELYERKSKVVKSAKSTSKVRELVLMMIDDDVTPDRGTLELSLKVFSALTYLNDNIVSDAEDIDRLIREQNSNLVDTTESVNLLLAAWAKSFHADIVENTERVFNRLSSRNEENELSYFFLFKAYSKARKLNQSQFASLFSHFNNCIEKKMLNSRVLTVFLTTLSNSLSAHEVEYPKVERIVKHVVECAGIDLDKIYHLPKISSLLNITEEEALIQFCVNSKQVV